MKAVYKITLILLTLCLTLGMAFTSLACFGGDGNNGGGAIEEETIVNDSGHLLDKDMESGTAYSLPARLTFYTPTELSQTVKEGITVKVPTTPEDLTGIIVDWSVGWANPADIWIEGRKATEFIEAIPVADGSLTAVIKCLEPFYADIELTIKLRSNPAVYVQCTVDYVIPVDSVALGNNIIL